MSLQNYQYDTIMREYSRRQNENRRILEEHQKEAYSRFPRLREIDQEVASLSAEKVRALLSKMKQEQRIFAPLLQLLLLRDGLFSQITDMLPTIWSCHTPAPSARIQAMWKAENAPVLRRRRLNYYILSQILLKF